MGPSPQFAVLLKSRIAINQEHSLRRHSVSLMCVTQILNFWLKPQTSVKEIEIFNCCRVNHFSFMFHVI